MRDSKGKRRGFTLIELLVVLAIIGLLVSLSLIALDSYKKKAQDARIEGALAQVRTVATLVYSDENSYENICKNNTLNNEDVGHNYESLEIIENDVKRLNGNKDVLCSSKVDAYCTITPLASSGFYCVDSSGYAGEGLDDCVDGKCQ